MFAEYGRGMLTPPILAGGSTWHRSVVAGCRMDRRQINRINWDARVQFQSSRRLKMTLSAFVQCALYSLTRTVNVLRPVARRDCAAARQASGTPL